MDPNHPMLDAARRALARVWPKAPAMVREGGSIPVMSTFQKTHGLPCILMGFGLDDDQVHAPNEKFSLSSYFGRHQERGVSLRGAGPDVAGFAGTSHEPRARRPAGLAADRRRLAGGSRALPAPETAAAVGFIATGVLVGPYGFRGVSDIQLVKTLADFACMFLLFTVGLELSRHDLKGSAARCW
jgi:hypothetical protein